MAKVENSYSSRRMFPPDRIGCLHRPRARVAASASIPSKYKTIVVINDEKKGFNSGTKRFEWQNCNESPGPAKYSITDEFGGENVSFSKNGLGSFASKVKRFPRKLNPDCFAGPGEYNPTAEISYDFNRANCTGNFHKAICTKKDPKLGTAPAPNSYNYTGEVIGKQKLEKIDVTHPPFMSKTKRVYMAPKSSNPAPNAYDTCSDDNLRTVQAPFKSTSRRLASLSPNTSNPGPGDYSPYDKVNVVKKTTQPRKHYLRLAAPALPMTSPEPPPGPGQYDIVDYDGPSKEQTGSSMFRSATKRWNAAKKLNSNPGPAAYNPQHIHDSFIHNRDNKWLC